MATILEQYRERQNNIRAQLAANSLPPEEIFAHAGDQLPHLRF